MNENGENKVRGIVGLYHYYKHQMNTVQRIGLLSLWIELSIDREEYEVAAGLQKELDKIVGGEEQFYAMSPSSMMELKKEEMENVIKESLEKSEPSKKKLKLINYWGTGKFEVFRLSFGDFKLVIFNIGLEML